MKDKLIIAILFAVILTFSTWHYAKHGDEQAGSVIYNQVGVSEDYDIDRWIEQQLEEEEAYEKWKQEQERYDEQE